MKLRNYNHLEDKILLEYFYNDQDNEWLGVLLQRYTTLLLGVCMKYLKNEDEAKDAVQQIFLKVINELHKYKVEYFKSWLYMVSKNHCLMLLTGKGLPNVEIHDEFLTSDNETRDLEFFTDKEKTFIKLEEAMEKLNEEQKACVKLFYLQHKSYQQISESTGYSLMQVKSNIQNGKRNLKLQMESVAK